jgi:transcription initiation factor TFIID TATA-box-binding protein
MPRLKKKKVKTSNLDAILKDLDVGGIITQTKDDDDEDNDEDREGEQKTKTTTKQKKPTKGRGGGGRKKKIKLPIPDFLADDAADEESAIKCSDSGARRLEKGSLHFSELVIGKDIPAILRNTYKRDDINTVPTVENYVCTFSLSRSLSLPVLVRHLYRYGAECNSKNFASVTLKFKRCKSCPSAVALIFDTGQVVCTGTKSRKEAIQVAEKFSELIRTKGAHNNAYVKELRVCNIVGTLRMGVKLDLRALSHFLAGSEYEPDNFPGLIYKNEDLVIHFIVYDSGKIVITGARRLKHIVDGARYIAQQCCYVIKGSQSAKRIHATHD